MAMMAATTAFAADLAVVSTYTLPAPGQMMTGDETEITVPSEAFAEVNTKSTLRFNFGQAAAEGQISVALKVGASWTWTEITGWDSAPSESFDLAIADVLKCTPEDAVSSLKERGCFVKGKQHTLVSVQVLADARDVVEYELVNEYTPAEPFVCDWNNDGTNIPASEFAKVNTDSKIEILFTAGSNPQIQPAVKVGADWTWTQLVDSYNLSGSVFTIKIPELSAITTKLTPAEFVDALHLDGLYIKGNGFTFNGMKLYNPKGVDGISDAIATEEIDLNAPVEIYNLQGMRVNEMTEGNLYIVRQGNLVKKMVK